MSIIYYHHFHPTEDFKSDIRINSDSPIAYDLANSGYFSDRIYHSRNSNARFYIITFGYEKGWARKLEQRTINRYIIHFIFDGKGAFNNIPIKKGDIYIVPPNVPHEILHDSNTPMTLGWIALSGMELEHMIEILHLPTKQHFTMNDTQLEKIRDIFIDTVYSQHPDQELPFYMFSRFFDAISVSKIQYDPNINTNNVYIDHALSYINTYYRDDLTVSDIAQFLHVSVSRLRSVFASELGYSPQEAIVKKRMAVAKSLLSSEKIFPIHTVASMCGYTDQSAFYRRFKKEYGLSPSEYAQKKRTEQL